MRALVLTDIRLVIGVIGVPGVVTGRAPPTRTWVSATADDLYQLNLRRSSQWARLLRVARVAGASVPSTIRIWPDGRARRLRWP
jgi:hypothetical protein